MKASVAHGNKIHTISQECTPVRDKRLGVHFLKEKSCERELRLQTRSLFLEELSMDKSVQKKKKLNALVMTVPV